MAVLGEEKVMSALTQAMQRISATHQKEAPFPFKIVVHCGEAYRGSFGWYGSEIDHALCILDAVGTGFPIVSENASRLPLPEGFHRMSLGMHLLKDLRPSEELFAVHSDQQTRMDFSIPRSLGAYRQNLPAQPTPFLGRQDLLEDLRRRLSEPDTRMITLLGPGGFGKTRSALQVAASLVDQYEGVYWVPLAPLTSEDRLTSALADSIGLVFYKGEAPFQKVTEALSNRKTLLIFDNFEHLTSGRDYVRKLCEATPTQVIVTSREALHIPQEKIVEISGLKYPESAEDPTFDEFGATQLFITSLARAGRMEPLDASEKISFVDICGQLHGMPLGIEMSAALAANHPLTDVAKQLRERIDYLAVALPHLPERQKSTRAVFEYSWNLLEKPLRKALGRLSIIHGDFDDEAARLIAHCDLSALRQLHERSLVVILPDGRKVLHEMVRYYAKEHLYENPVERENTLETHAKYYLSFLRKSLPLFEGHDQRTYLEAAADHQENIQVAFLWAVENAQWRLADQTLEANALFFDRLAKFQEGRSFFNQLLKGLEKKKDEQEDEDLVLLRANLLSWRASLGVRMGLNEGSEADLEKCLRVFKGKAHERRKAQALLVLGQVLEAQGKKAESIDRLSHALAQFESCKDANGAAYARNRLGQGLLQWGQMGTAASLVREALAHYQKTDNPSGMAWSRMLLGQMAVSEAKYDEAKKNFREGLEGYLTVGNRDGVSWSMNMMGQVAKLRGDYVGAEQMFLEALNIEDEISNHAAQAWTHSNLVQTEWLLGRPDQAEHHVHRALEIYEGLGDKSGMASVLCWMGNMALGRGEFNEAERCFLKAKKEIGVFADPLSQAWHEYHMALLAQKRGQWKEAEKAIDLAMQGFKKSRHVFGMGWGYLLAAELAFQKDDHTAAKECLLESLKIAKERGLSPIILEGWLVWASLSAKKNNFLEAVEWAEAVIQNPKCSKPTVQKASLLREEWDRKLDADSRLDAHHAAAVADLDIWTERILNTKIKPKAHAKPKPALRKK